MQLLDVLLSTIKQYDEEHEPSDQKKILGMLRSTANIKKAFTHKGHDDKYLGIMVGVFSVYSALIDIIVIHDAIAGAVRSNCSSLTTQDDIRVRNTLSLILQLRSTSQ